MKEICEQIHSRRAICLYEKLFSKLHAKATNIKLEI